MEFFLFFFWGGDLSGSETTSFSKPSTKAWPHAVAVRLFVPWMLWFGGLENCLKWVGGVGVVGVVVESFISLDVFFELIFGDRWINWLQER